MRKLFLSIIGSVVCCAFFSALDVFAQDVSQGKFAEDLAKITKGVDRIPKCGAPGPIVPLGDDAFPIVLGKYEDVYSSVVAASLVGKGRVVAFGHTDYCNASTMDSDESSRRFFKNVITWASGRDESTDIQTIRVAVWRNQATAEFLKKIGFDAFNAENLSGPFQVFIAGAVDLKEEEYDELFKSIDNGAGFLTCGLGWGWSQLNPGKSLRTDHSGNKAFAKHGVNLCWTMGFLEPTVDSGYRVDARQTLETPFVNASEILDLFARATESKNDAENIVKRYDANVLKQVLATDSLVYSFLQEDQKTIVDKFVSSYEENLLPSEKKPVRADDAIERLIITIQTRRFIRGQAEGYVAADEIPALAAARSFPGVVSQDAERLSDKIVSIKTATPDWASTGLYAAPGETITFKVDPELFKKFPEQFRVRIGSHRDTLWRLNSWKRYPEIVIEKPFNAPTTTIANPFGGLIYIVVPHGIGSAGLGRIPFSISGGVAAPYFVRDETSLEDWQTIRQNPAPWAELQGRNVVVTVPSEVVRDLDNPQDLMEAWDTVLDLEAEFASGPYVRERPERICCDRQISAGYMHSGYPVMTQMDVKNHLVDAQRLRSEGDWGFYHEFGHNHQSSYWTFEGSTEVTVNYFTLYVMEKFNHRSAEEARGELTRESRLTALKNYVENGANFGDWKRDPFLALNMTVQLKNEFGWEPFLRTVNEYRKATPDELPKNDQEKRDQWMVRLSKNSGKNLAPFFDKWGFPISQSARDAVKDLPVLEVAEFNEL